MSTFEMKLPDVGEGVAEAEIVEWLVAVGDEVTTDSPLAEVLTDKATVEVSSPVAGTVVELHGDPGDMLAVGSNLIGIEVAGDTPPEQDDGPTTADIDIEPVDVESVDDPVDASTDQRDGTADDDERDNDERDDESDGHERVAESDDEARPTTPAPVTRASAGSGSSGTTAAPAVRKRAADLDIDLATVAGSGPDGRVVHADLDRVLTERSGRAPAPRSAPSEQRRDVPIRGLRRRISERLTAAWTEIPHITYVEAVDVTELERLRSELNAVEGRERLTLLPFLVRAIAVACRDQPELNAHYDHGAETLTVVDAVHVGIATQTDGGLMVPVVRDAETLDLRALAGEIGRVTAAARDGSATRDELSGSTITMTSLGALGGLVTTPILNAPEVAVIGVNKIETRPVWIDGAFQPRQMLNLSSSFDHRMVDGWDAATFVGRIRALLETPALLFIDD